MKKGPPVVIVGAGIFGVTAALEMHRRGHPVRLLDPGPVPHPLAASTDISKAIRIDYGPDVDYMALAELALEGWREWNRKWPEPLFHETGVLFLRHGPMGSGAFEEESYRLLIARGHRPERLDGGEISRRFPAFRAGAYEDGYFNPEGGYAESGKVVARLIDHARAAGVELWDGRVFDRLIVEGSRVGGIAMRDGSRLDAGTVVVAAGSWTPYILPWMRDVFRSVGMPVFHLEPTLPDLYRPDCFPVFCADIAATGWYGFPLHRDGAVKVANHGPGRSMHPEAPERSVTDEETWELRRFLAESLPSLADAPIVRTRVCLYCDTWDEHFWIAPDPEREGLVLATGDSGHAFKFAPVLGSLIADIVEGKPNPYQGKFRWRPETRPVSGEEAARRHE